jgi:dihydropteroate synthase
MFAFFAMMIEIASNSNENAVGVNLLEECSVESGIEACRAMEELQRVLPVLMAISKK